ncbi:MAG TPA: YoaK family protein [Gemmatimonadaceae bacterium]|nr:YoaK family protein [Gemmatimonadaceae bacterium]
MSRERPARDALLVLLSATAGWLDALSYVRLGHVFTSFMSGNVVFIGLGMQERQSVAGPATAIAAFVAGCAAGAFIVGAARPPAIWAPRVLHALAVEWVALLTFVLVWWIIGPGSLGHDLMLMSLGGFAMGVQSAAVLAMSIPGVITTVITSTIALLGEQAVLLLHRRRHGQRLSAEGAWLLAGITLAYTASAVLLLTVADRVIAPVIPVTCLTFVIAASVWEERHHRATPPPDPAA